MSAIWGKVNFVSQPSENIDGLMTAIYKKRCKIDRYNYVQQNNVYWGCGLQYITKEASSERLPVFDSEKGIFFNADCILDNRAELIAQLRAAGALDSSIEADTLPDGTLMYLTYLKWGIECLKHFRGLYSMAVYESKANTLYLATDQTASRCLYYSREKDGIIFSTLMDPILAVYPQKTINEMWFKDYLTVPGLMPGLTSTETPYSGVFLINPGVYLKITPEAITEIRYWEPADLNPASDCKNARDYSTRFRSIYEDCLKDAIRTSGEVAAAMSSGLDSSTVGALAAIELAKEGKKLETYTYVPVLNKTILNAKNNVIDETEDVKQIAAMYPNMTTHFVSNDGKNCLEDLEEELEIMEFPYKAFTNLPNLCEIYRLSAASGCKVVLTGQCGNSSVSHGYIDDVLYDLYSHGHFITFLKYLNNYSPVVHESRKQALKGCIKYFKHTTEVYNAKDFTYTPSNTLVSKKMLNDYPMQQRFTDNGLTLFENVPTDRSHYHSWMYNHAMLTYMGCMETKLGLAHGIVIRDATKDMRMLAFCYHLPYKYFAYEGTPRWLIRCGCRDLLPAGLLDNWMRYGVQNADFTSRIERDFSVILPKLKEVISSDFIKDWIDTDVVSSYLAELEEAGNIKHFADFDNLVYLYILTLFGYKTSSK